MISRAGAARFRTALAVTRPISDAAKTASPSCLGPLRLPLAILREVPLTRPGTREFLATKLAAGCFTRARLGLAVFGIIIAIGAAGCGPSAAEVQRAQAQALRSQEDAARAQAAAAQAQKAAEAAGIEADRARTAVDDAMREINRVSDHVDQINRDRAARNARLHKRKSKRVGRVSAHFETSFTPGNRKSTLVPSATPSPTADDSTPLH